MTDAKLPPPGQGIDPAIVTIVGVDTEHGPDHDLWQPGLTAEPDEELAESLGELGQIQDIVVRQNGATIEVVAGRERVKAARLWNEANPDSKILLKWKRAPRDLDGLGLVKIIIAENEHRNAKPVLWKARMAARMCDRHNRPVAEVATLFRVSAETVREWLRTLSTAAPEIVKAAESGEVTAADVKRIADMTHADQVVALELVREANAKPPETQQEPPQGRRVAAARASGGKAKRGSRGPRATKGRASLGSVAGRKKLKPEKEIRAALEEKDLADNAVTWREFGLWVLGERAFLVKADA